MIAPIVFGSSNKGKLAEAQTVGQRFGMPIIPPAEVIGRGAPPDVDEVGETYRANALLKARAYREWSGAAALGDDTGLEVEALGGAPGVFTARYAGPGATGAQNIGKLLAALQGVENRAAVFRCVLVVVTADDRIIEAEGELVGSIAHAPRGSGGFGYDNVFVVEGLGRTLAELKEDPARDVVTHRRRALEALARTLTA